jgi:hypothetical protein
MRELYESVQKWQNENQKRLHSISVQKDGDMFCRIALSVKATWSAFAVRPYKPGEARQSLR